MPLLYNLERVAALLYRQSIINLEQLQEIRSASDRQKPGSTQKGRSGVKPRPVARNDKKSAVEIIESLKINLANDEQLDEDTIMRAIANEYHLSFKKLDPLELDADIVTNTVPKPFALKHFVLPLYSNGESLTVAVVDPEEKEAVEQVKMVSGYEIQRVICMLSDIKKTINQFYGFHTSVKKAEMDVTSAWSAIGNLEQLSQLKSEEEISSTDQHIQSAVEFILKDGLMQRASDIHIEPKREQTIVRMRLDGVLVDTQKMPQVVHNAIVSRIKLLARLDISEKRRPQDGRIKVQSSGKEVEMRVSTMPVAFGEKVVIRIFDPEMASRDLEQLGFFPEELARYKRFLDKSYGMILVTGPTGSGKTSTLYSSLQYVHTSEKNIMTIEDPIEMVVPQYNQIGVQPNIELTFGSALRSILRQDPDVIMIGEIRDRETAENAIQAALTGHLVLSTLHTNDTVSSLTRLYDIGIDSYLVKSSLLGVVAQRLVRVICGKCKTAAEYPADELAGLGIANVENADFQKGAGCEHCRFTGYYGRMGVHEVLEINDAVRKYIGGKTSNDEIKLNAKKAGMKTLWENAMKNVVMGITTLEEALRVFSD
ncbi:MAG: type II secretion system protein E [bacterium]|nr:MAG: type II secretion system protein E [bacterium]